jgi:hypothetical protein
MKAATDALSSSSQSPPSVLYHYTDAAGLHGIIKKGGMYLTDARFLNDASEISYGEKAFLSRLEHVGSSNATAKRTLERIRGMDRWIGSDGQPLWPPSYLNIASFCEDGNLLSQWRAYGSSPSGAFSIGFTASSLLTTSVRVVELEDNIPPKVSLRKVLYKEPEQDALIDAVISAALQHAPFPADPLQFVFTIKNGVIPETIPQLKANVFEGEQEWRLVGRSIPRNNLFRVDQRGLVPYLLALFQSAKNKPLPIERIYIGPSPRADLNEIATRELLLAHGFGKGSVEIERSTIPLRF